MIHSGFRMQKTVLGSLLLIGTLLLIPATDSSAAKGTLWQSRDQFVALEGQGDATRNPPANSHPCTISKQRLEAMLESLEVRLSDSDPVTPLFTRESLDVLVPQLQTALQQAGPGEDVTFAVIGLYRALLGLAKSPRVTTGRLFVKDGSLHIIFGLVQQDFKERDDRRLSPFTPGDRYAVLPGEWKLLPRSGQNIETPRKDWVVFREAWQAPVEPLPPAVIPPPAAPPRPAAPVTARPVDERRSPADRLLLLNELKGKGLISDEEYRTKRMSILNEL